MFLGSLKGDDADISMHASVFLNWHGYLWRCDGLMEP